MGFLINIFRNQEPEFGSVFWMNDFGKSLASPLFGVSESKGNRELILRGSLISFGSSRSIGFRCPAKWKLNKQLHDSSSNTSRLKSHDFLFYPYICDSQVLGRVDGVGAWVWEEQRLISKQAACKKNTLRIDARMCAMFSQLAIACFSFSIQKEYRINNSHPNAGVVDEHQSAFADHLLCNLGKGAESCAGLQQAAAAVVVASQGHCSQLTKQLAGIGTAGANSRNCERDLFRLLRLPIEP